MPRFRLLIVFFLCLATQFSQANIHYAPYDELLANQNQIGITHNERYKFTGKERDAESGYDYFGARFLAQQLGIWLSVDPLVDKYLGISPYAYCAWNPIKMVDPNGEEVQNWIMKNKKDELYNAAQNHPDDMRSLIIFAHGSPKGMVHQGRGLGVHSVAAKIKESDYWNETKGDKFVILFSCSTGETEKGTKKSFGQELSQELSKETNGGDVYVWSLLLEKWQQRERCYLGKTLLTE